MALYAYVSVVLYIGIQLIRTARSEPMRSGWGIVAGLRVRHFGLNIPVMVVTVVLAEVMMNVSWLSTGWWGLLGGEGSIVMAKNSNIGGPIAGAVTACLLVGVLACSPALALVEERFFREGCEVRSVRGRLVWALGFGLAHSIMGIPTAVCLALSAAGIWFTGRYLTQYRDARSRGINRRGAREESTAEAVRYHIAWNWTIVLAAGVLEAARYLR